MNSLDKRALPAAFVQGNPSKDKISVEGKWALILTANTTFINFNLYTGVQASVLSETVIVARKEEPDKTNG